MAIALIVVLAGRHVAPDLRAGLSLAGEPLESRANGAGLIDVWSPLLAKYVGGLLVGALVLRLGKSMDVSFLAIGRPAHLLITAALIAGFAYMRAGSVPGEDARRPVRMIALAQIVICCGGEWLLLALALPFLLDGASLIVIVAVAMNYAWRFTDLANPYAPPYAAPPGQSAR